jgi:hypothetical protein
MDAFLAPRTSNNAPTSSHRPSHASLRNPKDDAAKVAARRQEQHRSRGTGGHHGRSSEELGERTTTRAPPVDARADEKHKIAELVTSCLSPYYKDGTIKSKEDFKTLNRQLCHKLRESKKISHCTSFFSSSFSCIL